MPAPDKNALQGLMHDGSCRFLSGLAGRQQPLVISHLNWFDTYQIPVRQHLRMEMLRCCYKLLSAAVLGEASCGHDKLRMLA